jgi:RluA family pseudouridine synthase
MMQIFGILKESRITIEGKSDSDIRPMGNPIGEDHVGMRLDWYMSVLHPFYSRAAWQKKIKKSEVYLNSLSVRPSAKLKIGDQISMFQPRSEEPKVDKDVRALWEAEGVMAVYKPACLPMHANGAYLKNTFAWILNEKFGDQWAAVHRLDMETSGIVLCASSTELRHKMSAEWIAKKVKKKYQAIVHGNVEDDEYHVDQPIGDLNRSEIRIKKWINKDGQDAQTEFTVLARGKNHTLIEARPITGRTNQIRIHSAWTGHVLVGDKLFHPDEKVFLSYWEEGDNDWVHQMTGFKRLCLHAASIEFPHPVSGEILKIETPIPPDMQDLWSELENSP